MKTEKIVRKAGKTVVSSSGTAVIPEGKLTGLLTTCPFTGEQVRFAEVGPRRDVYIYGPKYLIGPFFDLRRAQHFFSTRNGVPPAFVANPLSGTRMVEPAENPEEVFEGIGDPMKGISLDDA